MDVPTSAGRSKTARESDFWYTEEMLALDVGMGQCAEEVKSPSYKIIAITPKIVTRGNDALRHKYAKPMAEKAENRACAPTERRRG